MDNDLIQEARSAIQNAYTPYSDYAVGAAILTESGQIYQGCNIEFVSYTNTMHAEQVALATAINNGYQSFDSLAVTTASKDGAVPCGLCRQSLSEFTDGSLRVIIDTKDEPVVFTLEELLPYAFTSEYLE